MGRNKLYSFSKKNIGCLLLSLAFMVQLKAQDTIRYTGNVLSNVDYHHGQLPLAMGVHNIQVMRANRESPTPVNGYGWTYNHAPSLAYWNGSFYLQYLSNPVGEHVPPGQTLLLTSRDGYTWSAPRIVFPPYKVPDGFKKEGREGVARDLFAVMHQRMGFYVASNKKLLTLAYYGIAMDAKDDPNDGNGVGRVVREIKPDGNLGDIYFIRYNHDFNERNTQYPFYKKSRDKAFVAACDELLSKPLMMQQWNEEADRDDPLIPLKKDFKAFNFYHLPDGRAVGLWKHALTSISADGGKTWLYSPTRAPKFVNSNAKIWGQRSSDGRYATVYNPSEYRWPLAISVSEDGLNFHNLLLVNGEITPMRYGGNYKSFGPQYVRGIQEGDGHPPDGKIWVSYSMNKEDIWIASIPVPVTDKESTHLNEDFNNRSQPDALKKWNLYSPLWAPVGLDTLPDKSVVLKLSDSDPFDYAKAERLFPSSKKIRIEFSVIPSPVENGQLQVEIQDGRGNPGMRLVFGTDSLIQAKVGARMRRISRYVPGQAVNMRLELDTDARMYRVFVEGESTAGVVALFFAPLSSLERMVFRTGEVRRHPHPDTPADNWEDLRDAGKREKVSVYYIRYVKTSAL